MGGVDEIMFFAEGDCGLGGGFSGAGDQVQLSAVDLNLAELGVGGGVGGENVGLDTASGGVGSDGGPGVAGRVLDYLVDAKLSGHGEHYGSASVFERAGRGGELQLGIEGVQAEGVGESGQRDDWRVTFAEGYGRCVEDGFRIRGIGHDERGGALLAAQGTHVGGVVSGAGGALEGVGVHVGWVEVGWGV